MLFLQRPCPGACRLGHLASQSGNPRSIFYIPPTKALFFFLSLPHHQDLSLIITLSLYLHSPYGPFCNYFLSFLTKLLNEVNNNLYQEIRTCEIDFRSLSSEIPSIEQRNYSKPVFHFRISRALIASTCTASAFSFSRSEPTYTFISSVHFRQYEVHRHSPVCCLSISPPS